MEKIFVPDTDRVTADILQEFTEKNQIKTFADNERIKNAALKIWSGGSMTEFNTRQRVLRFAREWEQQKKIELAGKCFKLLAEAEPTVSQANFVIEHIKYQINQSVLKLN